MESECIKLELGQIGLGAGVGLQQPESLFQETRLTQCSYKVSYLDLCIKEALWFACNKIRLLA